MRRTIYLLPLLLLLGCESDPNGDAPTGGLSTGSGSTGGGGTGGGAGGATSGDRCSPPRAERPVVAEPNIPNRANVYVPDLNQWGIENNGTDPIGTRNGINDAIQFAAQNGYGTFHLPAGTYLVGEQTNEIYSDGIHVESEMVFELDPAATIQMTTNETWNYCAVAVTGKHDVIITGGTIRGDRDSHIFTGGGAHDEGHTLCIENESERVLVDNTTLTKANGDGILIVGQGGDGSSCKDIIVRNSEIHDNRRQGVSIVGGTRVLIEGNHIHDIRGTSPQFGIDIESLAYISKDIVIRQNSFDRNQGGDYVNTDGKNVWFEENTCDQTGLTEPQTDGPIVHWNQTDQTIRANTITVTVGSSNGRWGIIGYSNMQPRTNPAANYIEDNVFYGGGIHLANNSLFHVTGNTLNDWMILGTDIDCTRLSNNDVNKADGETYKFRRVSGQAADNRVNGTEVPLPMSDDAPFTNSPPHLW